MAVSDFFIWGQGGTKKTAEDIAREREMANTILQRAGDTSPVGHWSQGAARLVDALGGVVKQRRADAAETELKDYQGGVRSKLAELLSGRSSAPSSIPMSSAAGEVAATAPASVGNVDPSLREGIVQTASALGIDPVDLATAISYETAGTFDPTKTGPTTKYGQHRGLIQFGEPQAAQYGVDWNNPIGSQLGAEGAIAKYLRNAGVQPGMGMMDIYSAINAGRVGRYGASDAAAGGAPGTVADKVNEQMGGHRAKALALLGTAQPTTGAEAIEAVSPIGGGSLADEVSAFEGTPEYAAQFPGQTVGIQGAPPLEPPVEVPAAPAVAPVEVAGGGGRPSGINPAIIEALTDPRVDEGTRRLAAMLVEQDQARERASMEEQNWRARQQYEQQLRSQDPLVQAQIQKLQREAATGGETFFGNAVPYKDAEGNIRMGQLGNRGTFRPVPLEEGASFAPTTRSVNTGTEMLTVGPGGEILDRVPIQNREAAAEKAAGTVQGQTMAEREMAAPAEIQTGENALSLINDIRNDPYLERGTGFSSYGNIVRGTGGYDFANKVEQAKSGAFLTAIQQMKGLGALSNAEGQAATAAITRMDTATSKEGFLAALDDYEKIVRQAIDRAQGRMSPRSAAPRQPVSIGGYTIEEVE